MLKGSQRFRMTANEGAEVFSAHIHLNVAAVVGAGIIIMGRDLRHHAQDD